jgi:hypothetical protein
MDACAALLSGRIQRIFKHLQRAWTGGTLEDRKPTYAPARPRRGLPLVQVSVLSIRRSRPMAARPRARRRVHACRPERPPSCPARAVSPDSCVGRPPRRRPAWCRRSAASAALEGAPMSGTRQRPTRTKPGRRTLCTPERVEAIVAVVEAGGTDADACAEAGIAPATFYGWVDRGENGEAPYSEFLEALSRARARRPPRGPPAVGRPPGLAGRRWRTFTTSKRANSQRRGGARPRPRLNSSKRERRWCGRFGPARRRAAHYCCRRTSSTRCPRSWRTGSGTSSRPAERPCCCARTSRRGVTPEEVARGEAPRSRSNAPADEPR